MRFPSAASEHVCNRVHCALLNNVSTVVFLAFFKNQKKEKKARATAVSTAWKAVPDQRDQMALRGGAAVFFRLGTDSQNRQSQIY